LTLLPPPRKQSLADGGSNLDAIHDRGRSRTRMLLSFQRPSNRACGFSAGAAASAHASEDALRANRQ
jgi:hypothetical protein